MISYITIGVLSLLLVLETWWILRTIKKFWLIKDLFSDTYQEISDYVEHIKRVNELEKYYGDETLKELLEHGESTGYAVEEFLDIFSEFSDLDQINLPEFDTEEAANVDGSENERQF